MRKLLGNVLLLLGLVVLLAGCESVDSVSKEGGATVQDQGISPSEMAAMDAQARGVGDQGQLKGSALGTPGAIAAPAGTAASGRVIYFEYDSDEIKPEYRPIIESQAAYLTSHPNSVLTLEGHADERGTPEYNLGLGERRAIAVRKQLTLLGASAAQVRTLSLGEERPVAMGHDEASYSQNRRVEISY